MSRSAYYQTPLDWPTRDKAIIDALNQLVEAHPRWGAWEDIERRALGQRGNQKRIYRVYRQLRRNHPRLTKGRVVTRPSLPMWVPEGPNEVWSADFMSDALYHGSRFRTFNIIGDFNREAIAIKIEVLPGFAWVI